MARRKLPKPRPRRKATPEKVEANVREIRDYHEKGARCLREVPELHQVGKIRALAKEFGWNQTKVRKARQFADQYTPEHLDALCALLRRHLPHFGIAHIEVLVTVPDPQERETLERWCITGDASKAELLGALKGRRENLREGGRRRYVRDRDHALVQLEEMINTWERWLAVVREEPADGGQSVLQCLPAHVQQEVEAVAGALEDLGPLVRGELGKTRVPAPSTQQH
jgi:hypothetical protein